jgi:serine/threonine protein kinase
LDRADSARCTGLSTKQQVQKPPPLLGMVRAMKMISLEKMNKEDEEKLLSETSIMKEIDHANVVRLFEVFRDEQYYYLVSEYCDGIYCYSF